VKCKKLLATLIFISLVLSTSWQLFISIKVPVIHFTSNQTFTFSTSYIHITDDDNHLIIDASSVRGQILTLIDSQPGIHFREICQLTEREIGVVQYHVNVLMDFNKIVPYQDGRYVRYFINNSATYDECMRLVASSWNRPVDRAILSALYDDDSEKYYINRLARKLGMSRQVISTHVKKLKERGLVEIELIDGMKCISLSDVTRSKLDFLVDHDGIDGNVLV